MTATFNPAQFVDMETEEVLVRRPPLNVGDYLAMIGEITCVPWQSKDGTKSGLRYVVPLSLQVPLEEKARLGLNIDTIKLTDSIMLDQTENGSLDFSPGKNNQLRKYREALNMNQAGEKFSARKMQGQPVLVKLTHEIYEGEVQERIGGVAKAH